MEVKNRRFMICGMARSGIAAAKLLLDLGAVVTISDLKEEEKFGRDLDDLRRKNCVFALGCAPDAYIEKQDIMVISPGIAFAKPFVQKAVAAANACAADTFVDICACVYPAFVLPYIIFVV